MNVSKSRMFIGFNIVLLTIVLIFIFYSTNSNMISSTRLTKIKSNNMLSLLVETAPGSGKYVEATSNVWPEGYTLNKNLSKCEKGSDLTYDEANKKISVSAKSSDRCYVYFDKPIVSFSNYIKGLFTTQGKNNLYYHNGTIKAVTANTVTGINVGDVIDAGDGSYRYAGSSSTTNNYVCFGSDAESCPSDNLYRIIGVFDDRVKLIKATRANSTLLGTDGDYYSSTSYYWNKVNYSLANTEKGKQHLWSYSELNKTNLNKNYISYLDKINPKWSSMIDSTTWYVGGMYFAQGASANAKTAYDYELGTNRNVATPYEPVIAKIGLMYLSDYYYGASPTYWTYPGNNSDSTKSYQAAKSNNWMCSGFIEWTISPSLGSSTWTFSMASAGNTGNGTVSFDGVVRPSFNLKSSVTYVDGAGTAGDPYRVC